MKKMMVVLITMMAMILGNAAWAKYELPAQDSIRKIESASKKLIATPLKQFDIKKADGNTTAEAIVAVAKNQKDPVVIFYLLDQTARHYAFAANWEKMDQTISEMARLYEGLSASAQTIKILTPILKKTTPDNVAERLATVIQYYTRFLNEKDYESCDALSKLAKSSAFKKCSLMPEFDALQEQVKNAKKLAMLGEKLSADSSNPFLNKSYAEQMILMKRPWSEVFPYAILAGNPQWAEVAALERDSALKSDLYEKAGDVYWKLSKNGRGKGVLYQAYAERAGQYYYSLLDSVPASKLKQLEKKIAVISAMNDMGANKLFYPYSQSAVKKTLAEILARKVTGSFSEQQQRGLNQLNAFRYLCGVDYNTALDQTYIDEAQKAAARCEQAGKIAHELGDYTDKCNLAQGDVVADNATHVDLYMRDLGDNNKGICGHRKHCLSLGLNVVGFGQSPKHFGAMRVFGNGPALGKPPAKGWSYPGRGFYPKEFLHGIEWSYYTKDPVLEGASVKMWKLRALPLVVTDKYEPRPGEGEPIKIKASKVNYSNDCVFEPDLPKTVPTGMYWIQIKSATYFDHYLVHLY